jgi:hypothetical protein
MGPDATPRAPRFDIKVPLVLYLRDRIASGHSINVSESGMLATFNRRLDPWAAGHLCAVAGELHLAIDVHVVRVEGRAAAMAFEVGSEGDRATIRRLIEYAGPAAVAS